MAVTQHLRSLIIRREAKQLSAILDDARKILGGTGASFNGTSLTWRNVPGGRQIEFGGVANPGDEQKWRGQPHDLLAIDEADAVPESVVRFLSGWLRTTVIGQPCRLILCFNPPSSPEGRWLLDFFAPWLDRKFPRPALPGQLRWYATLKNGKEIERLDGTSFPDQGEMVTPKSRTFFPARVQDNKYLMATDYVAMLQSLPEPYRSQLLYGDFEAGIADDAWQVIPTAWVKAAMARWHEGAPPGIPLSCVGADIARGGRAKTVVCSRFGHWFARLAKYQGRETDDGPKAAQLVLRLHDGKAPVNIDVTGVGSSAYDSAKLIIGGLANPISNAAGVVATDRTGVFRMGNVRAAMFFKLRDALDPESGEGLCLPPDPALLADLTAPRFKVQARGVFVEEKHEVEKRLQRSVDAGDAVCLAFWDGGGRMAQAFVVDGNAGPASANHDMGLEWSPF